MGYNRIHTFNIPSMDLIITSNHPSETMVHQGIYTYLGPHRRYVVLGGWDEMGSLSWSLDDFFFVLEMCLNMLMQPVMAVFFFCLWGLRSSSRKNDLHSDLTNQHLRI